MKLRERKIIVWPLLLIFLLIVSAVIFNDIRATKSKMPISAGIIQENFNSDNSQQIADNRNINTNNNDDINSFADNRQLTTDNLSLPIIMYHHIRDFNDPNDQIGTNLSLSPTDFAKQLDLIIERGYTTINFQNILENNIPSKSVILTFDDGYENFYQNAYPELKKRNMKAISYVIVNNIGKGNYMNREQIIEIEQNGIEIGSHTLSHPDLAISSDTKATKEIVDSKAYLESLVGKKIISICYPSGKHSSATEDIIQNAGYIFAVTTKSGIAAFANPFILNRYRVNNGTSISAWVK